MTPEKNITWKKRKGEQFHPTFNIKAVGNNIKWGRVEGDGNYGEDNQDFKSMGVVKDFKLQGT